MMTTSSLRAGLRRGHARSLSLSVARPAILAPARLAVQSAALVAVTWNRWGSLQNDTGYDILAGVRVAHGELPYVDFVYWYGPLAPFAVGVVEYVGGAGMGSALALGVFLALLLIGGAYLLAKQIAGVAGGFVAGALVAGVAFAANQFSYVDPHSYSATLGAAATLAVLLALKRYDGSQRLAWAVVAGIACAGAMLTRPEFALGAALPAILWVILGLRAGTVSRRAIVALAVPALALPAATYGFFALKVGSHRLISEDLYPTGFLRAAGNHMLDARMPMTLASGVELAGRLILYAAGGAVFVVAGRIASRSRRGAALVAASGVVVGLGAVALSWVNPDALRHGLQFVYGWIPAGAVLAAIGLTVAALRRRPGAASTELLVATALAPVAFATYATFFMHSFEPQMAVYALPLAAVFLVWIHLRLLARNHAGVLIGCCWLLFLACVGIGLELKDARPETGVVAGPGGSLAGTPAEAATYNKALSWIDAASAPGSAILLAPQLTWLYVVADRVDPLPQLSLLPGALSSEVEQQAAIQALERQQVRVVITERRRLTGYGHTAFGQSFDRTLAAWVATHFTKAATLGGDGTTGAPGVVIWLRRDV